VQHSSRSNSTAPECQEVVGSKSVIIPNRVLDRPQRSMLFSHFNALLTSNHSGWAYSAADFSSQCDIALRVNSEGYEGRGKRERYHDWCMLPADTTDKHFRRLHDYLPGCRLTNATDGKKMAHHAFLCLSSLRDGIGVPGVRLKRRRLSDGAGIGRSSTTYGSVPARGERRHDANRTGIGNFVS
jgi:hypothetical protein